MQYLEVCINTPEAEIDSRCEQLAELGVGGFVIESEQDLIRFLENNRQYWDYVDDSLTRQFAGLSRIKFYLTDDADGSRILETIRSLYPSLYYSKIQDSDWENNWRQYYVPINVGEKLVVVPEWLEAPDSSRIPLRLDPGLIFGTGSHPTTRMCLTALEDYAAPGKQVVDIGCGSGILGIGALLLGCDTCRGIDVDPKAPDIACANAALNDLHQDRFQVIAGDITASQKIRDRLGHDFDIVLVNIVADVIIMLAPYIRSFMKEDAVFITSGIIENRAAEVKEVLEKNGFTILSSHTLEEWYCFVCK